MDGKYGDPVRDTWYSTLDAINDLYHPMSSSWVLAEVAGASVALSRAADLAEY